MSKTAWTDFGCPKKIQRPVKTAYPKLVQLLRTIIGSADPVAHAYLKNPDKAARDEIAKVTGVKSIRH